MEPGTWLLERGRAFLSHTPKTPGQGKGLVGALGCPKDGQGPFPAVAAKSALHTQPVQLGELSMELMSPCQCHPGAERHWGRAGLCRAAQQELIAVPVQQGQAPAPGLRLLQANIFPLLGGGEERSCFVLVDKLGTVTLPVGMGRGLLEGRQAPGASPVPALGAHCVQLSARQVNRHVCGQAE